MKPVAIFIDLDGTLLSDEKKISNNNRIAIKKYIECGGKVFIATGRSPLAAANIAQRLHLNCEYIAFNGAYIHLGMEQYRCFCLTQKEVATIIYIANKYDIELLFYTRNEVLLKRITDNNVSRISDTISVQEFESSEIFPERLGVLECECTTNALKDVLVLKISLLPSLKGNLFYAYEELIKLNFNVFYTTKYIEVTSMLSNKCKGAKYILDKYAINMEDIMAIGDGENDVELIECAGIGVAMANACDSVKQIAKYITQTNNEGGIAEVITKYILN